GNRSKDAHASSLGSPYAHGVAPRRPLRHFLRHHSTAPQRSSAGAQQFQQLEHHAAKPTDHLPAFPLGPQPRAGKTTPLLRRLVPSLLRMPALLSSSRNHRSDILSTPRPKLHVMAGNGG